VACLAGGRNKLVAAKAYDFFNAEFEPKGTHTLIAPFEFALAHASVLTTLCRPLVHRPGHSRSRN
jgi:hypothetical protein